jgi:hypothetical protein
MPSPLAEMAKDGLHLVPIYAEDADARHNAIGQERSELRAEVPIRVRQSVYVKDLNRELRRS